MTSQTETIFPVMSGCIVTKESCVFNCAFVPLSCRNTLHLSKNTVSTAHVSDTSCYPLLYAVYLVTTFTADVLVQVYESFHIHYIRYILLLFIFIFGLKFFTLVWFSFLIVSYPLS